VRLLLDTNLLIWASQGIEHLPQDAHLLMAEAQNELHFSVASIWEVAIKHGLNRAAFQVDPRLLRRGLIGNGYKELEITGKHAVAVAILPPIHKDPFDRLLIAQAIAEDMVFVTSDTVLGKYPGTVRLV
jgi:PIN domain nuclease of toxin-antitoxin system